jgi:putative membrane protein
MALGSSSPDPRVYFAAERTLLAWLRTGLTVMAFGFVIARFGLFLRLVAVQAPDLAPHASAGASTLFGIALVVVGTAMIIAATLQYRQMVAGLPEADRPRPHSGGTLIIVSSFLVALVGLGLTAYLLLTSG